ncbi:MAG: asparagine synthase-related protein, partial [Thermoplasmata archaeon]
ALGRSIFAPYLDPKFVAVARSIRIELRQPGARPKGFFRDWAETQGVPAAIAQRPKRALQYGSGIDRLLARIGPRLGDRTERRSLGDGFDRMAK